MSEKGKYLSRGQEVKVPEKFGEHIVEVIGISPGSVLVRFIGTAIAVPSDEIRDLRGEPFSRMEGRPGRIYR